MGKIVIDPITRIEGHLKIEAEVADGVVIDVKSTGTLFRGFETILQGRDPRDAQQITQRICGVCPTSHSMAAALSLDSAFGIADKIPDNGRILRNLILGAAQVADHILHFYHLAALDYVDVTRVAGYEGISPPLKSVKAFIERGELAPFFPRYEGDYRLPDEIDRMAVHHYVRALDIRRKAQEMVAIFGGKLPHNVGIVPGGVTSSLTVDKITHFFWRLNDTREFIDNLYIPDVLAVAEHYSDYFEIGVGCKNLLSFGAYELDGTNPDYAKRQRLFSQGCVSADLNLEEIDTEKITEHVKHSWYKDKTTGLHPTVGKTEPDSHKAEGYSWIKAPRYNDMVYEVGPLAHVAASYLDGQAQVKELVDTVLSKFNAPPSVLFSTLGRHAARAIATKVIADSMAGWLLQLKPGEPVYQEYELPEESEGMGIVDASRGALGHWIKIKDKKIAHYQCVVPTTWNASPKDDKGRPGPIEQAIIGARIKDENNPFEIVRIVRSFDPCIACAVHLVNPKGKLLGKFRVM